MSGEVSDFLVWVGGASYSRKSFIDEAKHMGACRRVPFVPVGVVRGDSRVFLVSDMTDEDRRRYKTELKRRDAIRYEQWQEQIKEGLSPEDVTTHARGPMPRGTPLIFAWFTVRSITYVVGPGVDIPKRLKELGVSEYEYIEGEFGFDDERECGSLVIGGTYLLSEENMEKCKNLASSSAFEGRIELLRPSYPYAGKRFRGIKAFSRKLGDRLVSVGG